MKWPTTGTSIGQLYMAGIFPGLMLAGFYIVYVITISYLKPERDPETGRTNMVPTGEEFTYNCELAFIAAGFVGCESYVADAFGVSLTGRGCVDTDHFRTNVDKVFACGDMRRGQSLVVWGLREGRDCAAEVDRYLMGYTNL